MSLGASELDVIFGAGSFLVGIYGIILARRALPRHRQKRAPNNETPDAPTSEASETMNA